MSATEKELNDLLAIPTTITINGTEIPITPLRFGELPTAIKLGGPILGLLVTGNVTGALMQYPELVSPLTGLLSRMPQEWVDQLAIDEAIELLGLCLAVNADFFSRRVSPALVRLIHQASGNSMSKSPTQSASQAVSDAGPVSQQS